MPSPDLSRQISFFDTERKTPVAAHTKDTPADGAIEGRDTTRERAPKRVDKQIDIHPLYSALKVRDDPYRDVLSLEALSRAMDGCTRCGLSHRRKSIVFGEGDPCADLMLIGEGPGANEDLTGRPFVGAAGQLLDKILESAGLSRERVYIANVVKCRPPDNRLPEPAECAACLPHLLAQVRIIEPRIIVCLGALATQTLIDPSARITKIRGTWHEKAGIKIMPTYHPAALLRDPSKKRPVWEDFQKIREEYSRA